MLPTGHIAAGYLVGLGAAKALMPELPPETVRLFGLWGAFWGFAPDLDEFWYFIKNRTWLVSGKEATEDNHRKFPSHAPILWFIAGLGLIVFARDYYLWLMGYVVWLAAWSHFLLDSIEYGIMWFWPFKSKLYALRSAEKKPFVIEERNFFKHSLKFLLQYTKRISFYLEIVIIVIALAVFIK